MILFFLIAVLSFLVQLFLPWWSLAVVAFLLAFLIGKKGGYVFLTGFFASGIVWMLMALYIHLTSGHLMTDRVAELLTLPASFILFIAVFLIAAIVGGLAALTGFYLREIIFRKPSTNVSQNESASY